MLDELDELVKKVIELIEDKKYVLVKKGRTANTGIYKGIPIAPQRYSGRCICSSSCRN